MQPASFGTFIISLMVTLVTCQSDNGTLAKDITGQTLVDIGRKYNKPLLMLIGKSMMNVECRGSSCSAWSEWSACEPFAGQFGMRQRWRQCGGNLGNGCRAGGAALNDTMTEVCLMPELASQAPATCPTDYELTGGFCLKYYAIEKTKRDAQTSCEADGGHLLNINSASKWAAHESLMLKHGYTGNVYIDGERTSPSSPWVFSYETGVTGYTNWADNDPDNTSTDLCMFADVDSSSVGGIYDNNCTGNRHYVCEVV